MVIDGDVDSGDTSTMTGFITTAAVDEASSDGVEVSFRRSFFFGSQLSSPLVSTLAMLLE